MTRTPEAVSKGRRATVVEQRLPSPWVRNLLPRVRPAVLASWLKHALGVRRVVLDTEHGKFDIDPISNLGASLLSEAGYEPDCVAAIQASLPTGGTFIDLGANEGFFSVIGSRAVGPRGRVIAIEPQPRLQPIVERNLRLNDVTNVTVVPVAVTDKPGTVPMFLSADMNTGSSSLSQSTRYPQRTVEVEAIRLADLWDRLKLGKVDLIKIDIEGFEYEAMLGSPEVFREGRIVRVLLELHDHFIRRRGLDPAKVLAVLEDAGYVPDPRGGSAGVPRNLFVKPGAG